MRISGITTCVGNLYAGYLSRALPVWLETLDEVVIVTDPNTRMPFWFMKPYNIAEVRTDAFTRDGANFNKGAALNVGMEFIKNPEWLLHFDADIIPPSNWRAKAEPQLKCGHLYGCHRDYEGKARIAHHKPLWPLGYFQLWHASDSHTNRPYFTERFPHAGGYDADFSEQWPRTHWKDLGFRVLHQGESRKHWYGVGNEQMTRELITEGIRHKRKRPDPCN